jgi:hypothetical protein
LLGYCRVAAQSFQRIGAKLDWTLATIKAQHATPPFSILRDDAGASSPRYRKLMAGIGKADRTLLRDILSRLIVHAETIAD